MTGLHTGEVIDDLYVFHRIGSGATASVYLVQDQSCGEIRALKLLTRAHSELPPDREWSAIGAVTHDNVVHVFRRVRTDAGHEGVLMEFVPGPTLRQWASVYRPTVDEAVHVVAGILDGLVALHAAKLVHRDLKPGNIILAIAADRVQPRLVDFGLAKDLDADLNLTAPDAILGTPTYMSPEQLLDPSQVEATTDLFAAGVILYELLTASRLRSRHDPLPEQRTPGPDEIRDSLAERGLPDTLIALTVDMLAREPQARPSAASARTRLTAHLPRADPRALSGLPSDSEGGRVAATIASREDELVRQALASTVRDGPRAHSRRARATPMSAVAFGLATGLVAVAIALLALWWAG